MNPEKYRYTERHEWICPVSGDKGKIGLTDYAQNQLGDIVFLELLPPGTRVIRSQKIGEIESVKAVSELFTPASGLVLEINEAAIDRPNLVNEDAYGSGWLVRLELSEPSELENLMYSTEYDEFIAGLSEHDSE